MKDLARELMQIEDSAAVFYHVMAEYFQDHAALAADLERFSEEEESHGQIMAIVADCLENTEEMPCVLEMNPSDKFLIRIAIENCIAKAREGSLSLQELGEAIVGIEFSEWNSLFFCMVNSLKDVVHECKLAAIKLQGHIRGIQLFLQQLPLERPVLARLKNLPSLWIENILVIDDDPSIASFLKSLLRPIGDVDIACDGREALDKIQQKYYALIISDIRMPRVDGIELYRQLSRLFPSIGRRFVFFSAGLSEEHLSFVSNNSLRLIEKPAVVKDILDNATAVLHANHITLN